jgi:hypothetical protein
MKMNQSTIMCDSNASIRSSGTTVSIKRPTKKSQKKAESSPEKLVVETPNPKEGPATIEEVIDRAMSIAKETISGVSIQEKNVLEHLGTYTEEPYEIIESYF